MYLVYLSFLSGTKEYNQIIRSKSTRDDMKYHPIPGRSSSGSWPIEECIESSRNLTVPSDSDSIVMGGGVSSIDLSYLHFSDHCFLPNRYLPRRQYCSWALHCFIVSLTNFCTVLLLKSLNFTATKYRVLIGVHVL